MDIESVLNKVGQKFISEIRRNLKAENKYVTGETYNSLRAEVTNKTLKLYGNISLLAISEGSKPSKKKPSYDMVERVMNWMKNKGIQPSTFNKKTQKLGLIRDKKGRFRKRNSFSARRSAAYAMSLGILRRGIKGSGIIERSYNNLRESLGNDIMNFYEQEISNEFKKIKITK